MREYCLVNSAGTVINMSTTGKPEGPFLTEEWKEKGYKWVPADRVNIDRLRAYRYWNERP